VLEEVGEAGAAGGLVPGSHVVPDVHRREREAPVLVEDHLEAVPEPVLLEG
jgi:hypothetical protein